MDRRSPTALPKYRGAAPIQRAVLAGDAFTGVCLMQMDKGLDTGDVIATELTAIGPEETAGDLTRRLAEIGARLARAWMPMIAAGQYERTPQDHAQATFAPKLTKEEGALNFARPANEEVARFRAFTPNPGASLATSRGTLRLWRASLEPMAGDPGTVLAVRPNLVVAFQDGALCLLEVQPEGKKRISGTDWANGARIRPEDDLRP
jgi:methionyl-tRNA formyltransferase